MNQAVQTLETLSQGLFEPPVRFTRSGHQLTLNNAHGHLKLTWTPGQWTNETDQTFPDNDPGSLARMLLALMWQDTPDPNQENGDVMLLKQQFPHATIHFSRAVPDEGGQLRSVRIANHPHLTESGLLRAWATPSSLKILLSTPNHELELARSSHPGDENLAF